MKRLTLKHAYHDALILEVRYPNGEDVVLEIDLCGVVNPSAGVATLHFLGVRNFEAVRDGFEAARRVNAARPGIDEIIAVGRSEDRGYLLDLAMAGAVRIDARGLVES